MIKKILPLLFTLIAFTGFGQNFWTQVDGTFNTFRSVTQTDNGYLFCVKNDVGVHRSTTGGSTSGSWVLLPTSNGYPSTGFNHVKAKGDLLFLYNVNNGGSMNGRGVWLSSDHGQTWVKKNNGLGRDTAAPNRMIFFKNGNIGLVTLYFDGANYDNNLYLSTDNGDNWTEVLTTTTTIGSGPLAIKSNGDAYFPMGNSLYKSTDHGLSWTSILSYPPNPIVVASNDSLYAMEPISDQMQRSYDGITWVTYASTGYPADGYGKAFVITSNDTMFTSNAIGSSSGYGVYRSVDKGKTWEKVNSGMTTNPQVDDYLYLTKDGYLWSGKTTNSLYKSAEKVYTSSGTTGLFKSKESSVSLTLTPNPASSQIKVSYILKNNSEVSVHISDANGRKLKSLEEGITKATGEHLLSIEVADLLPGIYYLTVLNADGLTVEKFVVTK